MKLLRWRTMVKTVKHPGGQVTPRLSLTTPEYAALSAFPEANSAVSTFDIAVSGQLTGSQVREALKKLKDRGLIEITSDESIALSDQGEAVHRRLVHQTLIIDLTEDGQAAIRVETEEDVDAALEEALSNLSA